MKEPILEIYLKIIIIIMIIQKYLFQWILNSLIIKINRID